MGERKRLSWGATEMNRPSDRDWQPAPTAAALPSILPSEEDERRRERNRDLEYESRLADEQENGPIDNRPDQVGWRQ